MEAIWNSGIAVIVFLQGLGEWLTAPMKFFSFLGLTEFYLLFMPALYWCLDASLGLRMGLILLLSGGLNDALKISFHNPRPYWLSRGVKALGSYPSFGLPSGHAQHAVSVWGLLAASLRHRWARGVALALMFLIGLSRVYLAAHFPSDVIGGWLIGALLLWAFLRWEAPVRDWLRERSVGQQILIAFLASLALLALSALGLTSLGDWQMPEAWTQNALASTGEAPDPLTPHDALNCAGTLFGMAAGVAWMSRVGGFRSDGQVEKRLARYLLGLIGVFILWYGLGAIFPRQATLLGYSLRYLRYALVGSWISVGAPTLFLRLKLAEALS
jgi:membrane-associated phospholipid phosphatase